MTLKKLWHWATIRYGLNDRATEAHRGLLFYAAGRLPGVQVLALVAPDIHSSKSG